MADLGTGATGYPAEVDTNPTPQTGSEDTVHLPGKGACAAVMAIEAELGVTPSQGKSTVKAYMGQEHDADGEHTFKYPILFMQDDVAASQSAVALLIAGATPVEIGVPWTGSIVGISVLSDAARSAGTLTVDATVNGSTTGLQAVLDVDNTTIHYASQAKDVDTFVAGDAIGVKITTDAGWLPTSANIVVLVYISFN